MTIYRVCWSGVSQKLLELSTHSPSRSLHRCWHAIGKLVTTLDLLARLPWKTRQGWSRLPVCLWGPYLPYGWPVWSLQYPYNECNLHYGPICTITQLVELHWTHVCPLAGDFLFLDIELCIKALYK